MKFRKFPEYKPINDKEVFVKFGDIKDVAYFEEGVWRWASNDKKLDPAFLNNIEWLDEESNVSSQEPDAIGQVLEDALLGLGSAKAIIDDTNAMEIDTPDNGAMSDCYQNLIEAMASIIKFQASKEIGEPLVQNKSNQ